jgi:biopolymer transport protein ExbB/TolQ
MHFTCPECNMSLKADADLAGKTVKCPGCATKLQIPATFEQPAPEEQPDGSADSGGSTVDDYVAPPAREGWAESDQSNINIWGSIGYAAIIFGGILGILFAVKNSYVGSVFFSDKSGTIVNACELFLFCWAFGILILKMQKIGHQRNAMLLDVLPKEIAPEINKANVGNFIDHVYNLPHRLRDSTMVNRIRKSLEFFETRQNNSEVANLMSSQSDIDASRIQGSYSLLKVFLWAVPILGFVGTVLGLSGAIGSIDASDSEAMAASLGNVTSGLGTAFNTTLFGLVLSLIMAFPISAVQKTEEDNLSVIDAYCNENLLTRLNDGGGLGGGDELGALDQLSAAIAGAQREFLTDLNDLSKIIKENAEGLEKRSAQHQQKVEEGFSNMIKVLQQDTSSAIEDSAKSVTRYVSALDTGIRSLNDVLKSLGQQQVVVQQVKKKGWFG